MNVLVIGYKHSCAVMQHHLEFATVHVQFTNTYIYIHTCTNMLIHIAWNRLCVSVGGFFFAKRRVFQYMQGRFILGFHSFVPTANRWYVPT